MFHATPLKWWLSVVGELGGTDRAVVVMRKPFDDFI